MLEINVPIGDYDYTQFSEFCKRFGCECPRPKRGAVEFTIKADKPAKFFWLGMNLNFHYDSGLAQSTATQVFRKGKKQRYGA